MSRLEIGGAGPLRTRREEVRLTGLARPCRVLLASDLHLGHAWSPGVARELERAAGASAARVVVLGGDLVDRARGLDLLAGLVRCLARGAAVLALPGNHEAWVGTRRVREAVREAGGAWLPDGPFRIPGIVFDAAVRPPDGSGDARVLCAHDPEAFPRAAREGYALVLSGHLHGGQCIGWEWGGRAYPGAFFWKWNGRRFEDKGSVLIVSQGASDTLPLRWRCPREVVQCELS